MILRFISLEPLIVQVPCCDCIVAHPADRQHIVPSYLKITQNDKLDSNELIPF